MGLTSGSRVGDILRGIGWPADDAQAERLMRAVGATDPEVKRGMRLYLEARVDRDAGAARRGRPDWWRRSGYVEQLADIAPADLLDRDAELAELATWCVDGDESFVWWQASARAGKSALMAWFVLHPPPGVWVVSFFVTARLATQADSAAFTDGLLDQLAAIVGEQAPPLTSPTQRDWQRRRLLSEAVAKAAAAGCRLVLLVDGLDEDCGSLPGMGLSSIAALLPKRPGDLAVIVAGRPDPPVPADVDHDHPLRTCRVRWLSDSPHARRVTELAERELAEVLAVDSDRHNGLGFHVLGLVTASGGGLDRDDLHVLTGQPAYQIDRLLRGVFGRTVAGRVDHRVGERVFLFTHETLREQAFESIGRQSLAEFQERLHAWADGYLRRKWPAKTPRYLIRGYFGMLVAAGDRQRMIILATDRARHARMLDVTGGDAGALAEIRQTQDLLLTEADPDLFALARLSIHRNDIEARNDRLPSALPALWAALGQPARAEALARSLPSPHRRVMALTEVAIALDDHERAVQVITEAEQVAGFDDEPRERFDALVEAAIRAAEADSREYSLRLISTAADLITSSAKVSEWSLRRFVEAATESGAFDLAEQVARSGGRVDLLAIIASSLDVGSALPMIAEVEECTPNPLSRLCLVKAVAAAGDLARVGRIITNAELAARESDDPVAALSRVAAVSAAAGERRRALALVAEAERSAHSSFGSDNLREDSLMELVEAAAAAGDLDRAERTARRITESRLLGVAWTTVVNALAVAGDYDRAEEIAHDIDASEWHDAAFSVIAQALVAAGEPERARRVAAHAVDRPTESGCLIDIARAAVAADDHPRAELLVAEAERMARETRDPHELAAMQAEVANALAIVGELARAERLARAIVDPVGRVRALIDVAQTVMSKGDREEATRIATAAVRILPRLDDSSHPVDVTVDAARAIALTCDFETAAEVAHGIVEPQDRLLGLSEVAMAAAEAGSLFHATLLVAHAEELARDIGSNRRLVHELKSLTSVMNRIGAVDRAARLTRDLEHPKLFVRRKLADPDPRDLAEVFATESWLEPLPALAWLQPNLVARIADEAFPES